VDRPFNVRLAQYIPTLKQTAKAKMKKKKKEIAVLFCYILECGCTQQLGAREDSAQIEMKPE
jgi:hypothetical protein